MRLLKCIKKHLFKVESKKLNIVAIGGGTGLSTMLRGIKQYTSNITAIVTVADDGGGSGFLRQDLGMLPPGDIRNCILALAQTEPIMEKLLNYRFTDGSLSGQNFGNLFLAAMDGISDNFEEAVKRVSDVLKVTGKVLPVTLTDVSLEATLKNGSIITGESQISSGTKNDDNKIEKIRLIPEDAVALPEAINSIYNADIVVLGPGSLYTSIIPNLLVPGISTALENTSASIVYVCNIMTQPGETDGMNAFDHVKAIYNHVNTKFIDYCVVNTQPIPTDLLEKYTEDGASIVKFNSADFRLAGIKVIEGSFFTSTELIRHDYDLLAKKILGIKQLPFDLHSKKIVSLNPNHI